jgi:nicotinate-nucleotide pyrophosphorylase (carboxylating)
MLSEKMGDGDHSSMVCIPVQPQGTAKLLVKDDGIIAGVNLPK